MAKITKLGVGESLVGEGNEVAHIDLIIGPRGSAAKSAFANALVNNKDGFTTLLAVVAPNLLAKPNTILFNKVTIKGAKQAVQMFGPAQHAVAKAVADSVAEGVIPVEEADDLFICVGVFIHWDASDDKKIHDYQLSGDQGSHQARRHRRAEGRRSRCQAQHRQAPVLAGISRAIIVTKRGASAPLFIFRARLAQIPRGDLAIVQGRGDERAGNAPLLRAGADRRHRARRPRHKALDGRALKRGARRGERNPVPDPCRPWPKSSR